MLTFESDYTEGAHPRILERLQETNFVQVPGYGNDPYTLHAKELIAKACGKPDAEIVFIAGGTQTNQFVIDTMLEPYEGVLAAETGHVSVHEAGAIEFTGHKVLTLPHREGLLDPKDVKQWLETFYADESCDHMVQPGMLYLTWPSEYGTLYSAEQLKALVEVAHAYHLPVFLDGARMGYGLMSKAADLTLPEIADLVDVFYIGGTKVGALIGEAVVYTRENLPRHVLTRIKQHGALLAKGRLIGLQFETLFTDDLYFKISAHAMEMAELLKEGLRAKGYRFFLDSPTNQQFLILPDKQLQDLKGKVGYSFWEKYDEEHTVVRFATSWATTRENVETLLSLL